MSEGRRGTALDVDLSRAVWRLSSRTGGNGDCVEVAAVDRMFAVRDSKDHTGPVLTFTEHDWDLFITGVKTGQFDR